MKFRRRSSEWFEDVISRCGVTWEGCYCGLEREHDDHHECIACAGTWSDAESDLPDGSRP